MKTSEWNNRVQDFCIYPQARSHKYCCDVSRACRCFKSKRPTTRAVACLNSRPIAELPLGCTWEYRLFQDKLKSARYLTSHSRIHLCDFSGDASEMLSTCPPIWTLSALITIFLAQSCFSTELSLHRRVNDLESVCRADFGSPGLSGCLAARAAILRSSREDADRLHLWLPSGSADQVDSPRSNDEESALACGRQWHGRLPREPSRFL